MEAIVCIAIVLLFVFIAEYWKIILPLVLIIAAAIIIFFIWDRKQANDTKEKIENSDEFKKSLEEAKAIKAFFLKNWREPFVYVSLYKKPYDYITSEDHSTFKFDSLAYIHIKMDLGYAGKETLNRLREYAEAQDDRRCVVEPYVFGFFDIENISEIPKGLNIDNLIWEVLNGTIIEEYNEQKVEFSIPILCPCNLKGESRKIFSEKI